MATLSTVATLLKAFYRLVGTVSGDGALVENSEPSADDVAYLCLNMGMWRAQHFLIRHGMASRWLVRTSAITSWSGTDAADGGRYTALPASMLRLAGDRHRSSLVSANGDSWGSEVDERERGGKGSGYYVQNERLYLLRTATPPNPIYIEYHARHAEVTSGLATIDFPEDARPLIVSEAADFASSDGWFPLKNPAGVEKRLKGDRREAKMIARRSHSPLRMRTVAGIGRYG